MHIWPRDRAQTFAAGTETEHSRPRPKTQFSSRDQSQSPCISAFPSPFIPYFSNTFLWLSRSPVWITSYRSLPLPLLCCVLFLGSRSSLGRTCWGSCVRSAPVARAPVRCRRRTWRGSTWTDRPRAPSRLHTRTRRRDNMVRPGARFTKYLTIYHTIIVSLS